MQNVGQHLINVFRIFIKFRFHFDNIRIYLFFIYRIVSEPCPSVIYQAHVRDVLLSNPQATTQFLNSLLNQLNWAFSEFIGMVQEIHNVSSRPERVFIESRQLKICATCFDLAISLLRVLEMISTVARDVFSDPTQSSSEILLARLCQVSENVISQSII